MQLVEVLISVFTEGLWPVGYTLIGVFVGLYWEERVSTERNLTRRIFRPLLKETGEVQRSNRLHPLPIHDGHGSYESLLVVMDRLTLAGLDEDLLDAITDYIGAIHDLARLHEPHVSMAEALNLSGYGDHLVNQLPQDMVANSDEGIDPTNRPDFPGPVLLVGTHTTGRGSSEYFEDGFKAPVRTTRRYPLFTFLLENFDMLRSAEGPDDLREICKSNSEIDVEYLDTHYGGWMTSFWDALNTRFESPAPLREELDISVTGEPHTEQSPLIAGETFPEVVRSGGIVKRMMKYQAREDVIDAADEIHSLLTVRLDRWIVDPRRWSGSTRSLATT